MSTTDITMPENVQEPTPEWYSAQVQKLRDIRGFLYGLMEEDSGSDESLPDMVKRMFVELQADLDKAKKENGQLCKLPRNILQIQKLWASTINPDYKKMAESMITIAEQALKGSEAKEND